MPSNVANAIDRVTSKPRYEHSSWGISVRDLSTGEVLLGRSGGKMFVPASTFKTFSGATVLDGYGPDYRFKTPIYRTGALKKGVVEGDLVMVASGDLSLGLREGLACPALRRGLRAARRQEPYLERQEEGKPR